MKKSVSVCDLCERDIGTAACTAIGLPGGDIHLCEPCGANQPAAAFADLIVASLKATPINQCRGHGNYYGQQAGMTNLGRCG